MEYKGPLHQMACTTPTDYWNDSCSIQELTYAIERGGVGATTNPTIVAEVLKKEMHLWKNRINQIIQQNPTWSEDEIAWQLIEEMAVSGAKVLQPVFEDNQGRKGRISIQTNPKLYRNTEQLVAQAVHFDSLAENIQVKIPATSAGIKAIEEATYLGVNINATVSFTVSQALAVAEAVENGLQRRVSEGKDVSKMTPVCTIMVGRLDDWMQVLVKRDNMILNPGIVHWAGVAAFKKAYQLYQKKGYHTRLLVAAIRHHYHWSEMIGGDVILTLPYAWQVKFNQSDIEVKERFSNPVDTNIIDELYNRFSEYRKAYDEDGLALKDFDRYGATLRTLRTFIGSYQELTGMIRDFMLPNPDVK